MMLIIMALLLVLSILTWRAVVLLDRIARRITMLHQLASEETESVKTLLRYRAPEQDLK